jgi:hypothetical protein
MTGVFVRLMMFVRIGLILRFARLERKNVTVQQIGPVVGITTNDPSSLTRPVWRVNRG